MAEYSDSETANSLIVLPEGFNVRGGFYVAEPALDHKALVGLQALSARRGITFVAGMMDQVRGRNLACLIEGDCPPVVLSRKQAGGRDCLYTPATTDETIAVLRSGVGITALICDDAGYAAHAEGDRTRAVTRVKCLNGAHNILCVPAFMTSTDSVAIAELWANSMTVILANGCASYPSVIRHADEQYLSTRYRWETKLCFARCEGERTGTEKLLRRRPQFSRDWICEIASIPELLRGSQRGIPIRSADTLLRVNHTFAERRAYG